MKNQRNNETINFNTIEKRATIHQELVKMPQFKDGPNERSSFPIDEVSTNAKNTGRATEDGNLVHYNDGTQFSKKDSNRDSMKDDSRKKTDFCWGHFYV